jgi:hypothetical protein
MQRKGFPAAIKALFFNVMRVFQYVEKPVGSPAAPVSVGGCNEHCRIELRVSD